jgi:hypothetical protein
MFWLSVVCRKIYTLERCGACKKGAESVGTESVPWRARLPCLPIRGNSWWMRGGRFYVNHSQCGSRRCAVRFACEASKRMDVHYPYGLNRRRPPGAAGECPR